MMSDDMPAESGVAAGRGGTNAKHQCDEESSAGAAGAAGAAPDGGWGWAVVFGTFMIHVIAPGIMYSFGVYLQDLVDYFESSRSAVAGVGSLMLGATWGAGHCLDTLVT